jgi:MFS family permease
MGMGERELSAARRWSMLGLGLFAQAASSMFTYGAAFLIPALQHERGMSLSHAGLIVAMPTIGLLATLIAWGVAVDRMGERIVLVAGPGLLCAATAAAAAVADSTVALSVALLLGGVGAASTNGASGRLIVGWFASHQRGLAMGIRQGAQPLGVALGALIIPTVAAHAGIRLALIVPAALAGLAALGCGLGVINPPRPTASAAADLRVNPYRRGSTLPRIHGVSVLLVFPQMVLSTFTLVWLHNARGWSLAAAGAVVTAAQLLGAVGRIASGQWSDRVGSRMRPLRTVAVAAAIAMAALALTDQLHWVVAVPIAVMAAIISVADNGLAFTAVAEIAGPLWSGRALGIQNTSQNIASAVIPPVFGALITAVGYPGAFATTAAIAAAAIALVPADTPETRRERTAVSAASRA